MTQQLLSDLDHWYGGDVGATTTGDFSGATGDTRSQQRIVRRLCTNPGDYIFHTEYGGGLPALIGSNASDSQIKAVVKSQLKLEPSVQQSPEPIVTLSRINGGIVTITIQYTDAQTRNAVLLSFNVSD
jgi:phage baseplate assembly protein W